VRFLIKKCPVCGRYTLEDYCPVCKSRTKSAHPPRFSPEDRYVKYRIQLKRLTESMAQLAVKMDQSADGAA